MKSLFALLGLAALMIAGCGKSEEDSQKTDGNQAVKTGVSQVTAADDHSGWWCAEHGIPEEECSMCNAKVAEKFKKDGDWCEKHDRADSQCFICHPERKKFYTAKYQAKFGKEPPKQED